ncbi:MAG: DUF4845 domain-containing protein [Pseudomonadales bacterium]|jgi:hypothetical protein|nr:DUF4845 domain-containing protein [Pseudomonadales bacterium]
MSRSSFKSPAKQLGMSMWGWLFVAIVMGTVITAVLRLGPHYIDFRIVQSVSDRLPVNEVHKEMSRAKILEHYKKQFRIEGFRIPLKDMMTVERNREQTVVDINYEVREHLFFNIDVVLVFSEQRTYN